MASGGREDPSDFAKQMKNLLNSKFTQNTFEDQNKEQFNRDLGQGRILGLVWDSDPCLTKSGTEKRNI